MEAAGSPLRALFHKLRDLAPLNADDEQAILALAHFVKPAAAHEYLVREGSTPTHCCLLASGYACRSKVSANGGRQIVSFHIAGDLLDLQHLYLERADHDVQTVTASSVVWIPMDDLRVLVSTRPNIAQAFWRDSLIDASVFREWVLNVGRRDAKTRIAHMLCEFISRCEAAGLGAPERMVLPFSQEDIADATGMTNVHVNRMLRDLSDEGVIRRDGRALTIVDWRQFRDIAGFDPGYLHLAA